MNLEKKPSISQRMFTLIRDVPNLNEEQVHEFMSKDIKYKTASGKSLLYRMIVAKYVRKDKNGILHAHIDEYKPLPPFKAKRKKKVVKVVKVKPAPATAPLPVWATIIEEKELAPKPAKKDFFRELGQRISSYFRA